MPKPKFDPSQPFEAGSAAKPKFDPSQPFEPARRVFDGKEERAAEDKKLVESMGPLERFRVGIGAGLSNIAKNVGDIASPILPDALTPDRQKWKEERELVAPVTDTTAGGAGEFVGEVAATLPIGMGAEGLVAKTAGRLLPRAGALAARLAGGAAPGYVAAGPDHRVGGAVAGGLTALALPYAGRLLGKAYRGVVKPSAAAQALREKGVEGMTIGQMSPQSLLAGFEEAGQSGPMGQIIKEQRGKGLESWRKLVLNQGRAPGAPELASAADPNAALAQAYEGFGPAYDKVRDVPVSVTGIGKALAGAADDPGIYATPEHVAAARRFLGNEAGLLERAAPEVTERVAKPPTPLRVVPDDVTANAEPWQLPNAHAGFGEAPLGALPKALQKMGGVEGTVVPEATVRRPGVLGPLPRAFQKPESLPIGAPTRVGRKGAVAAAAEEAVPEPATSPPRLSGQVESGALLQARSNIRKEVARRIRSGDETGAQLLGGGEDVLSSRLEAALPEDAAAALRSTDAKYAQHKVVSDAVRRGGDVGFTPSHLSAAVKKATESGRYARGGGGELRDIAQLGREVFDTRIPANGARALMRLPIPLGIGESVGDAIMLGTSFANRPSVQKGLLGEWGWQKGASATENWLRQKGILDALRVGTAERVASE